MSGCRREERRKIWSMTAVVAHRTGMAIGKVHRRWSALRQATAAFDASLAGGCDRGIPLGHERNCILDLGGAGNAADFGKGQPADLFTLVMRRLRLTNWRRAGSLVLTTT